MGNASACIENAKEGKDEETIQLLLTGKSNLCCGEAGKLKEWFLGTRGIVCLYKATQQTLSVDDFHNKCDNRGATLFIVKTSKGNVFGAYTEIAWKSSFVGFVSDEKCRLFSLKGPCGIEQFAPEDPSKAVYGLFI